MASPPQPLMYPYRPVQLQNIQLTSALDLGMIFLHPLRRDKVHIANNYRIIIHNDVLTMS